MYFQGVLLKTIEKKHALEPKLNQTVVVTHLQFRRQRNLEYCLCLILVAI